MDAPWFQPLLVVQALISLAAIVTGVGLIWKAFSFQNRYLVSLIVCGIACVVLVPVGLFVPLVVVAGQQYQQAHLTADLLMYGVSGLVVVAIACFIIDHVTEMPNMLMVSAAACFAAAIFPWIYWSQQQPLNERFSIVIVVPEPKNAAELEPLPVQATEQDQEIEPLPAGQLEDLLTPALLSPPAAQAGTTNEWLYDLR